MNRRGINCIPRMVGPDSKSVFKYLEHRLSRERYALHYIQIHVTGKWRPLEKNGSVAPSLRKRTKGGQKQVVFR